MSAHTPGPWQATFYGNEEFSGWTFSADNFLLPLDDATASSAEEAEANARLIAAAPDLLSALQQIQAACAQAPWFAVTHTSPQMDAARAAIAKATGGRQ